MPARHRFIFGLLVSGLLLVWIIGQHNRLSGVFARNAGFIAFNHAQTTPDDELARRGIIYLEQTTAGNRGTPSAWRALGYLYLMRGSEKAAVAAWRQSAIMPAELLTKGAEAEDAGNLEEALRWFQRATLVAPDEAEGWLRAGLVHESRDESSKATVFYQAGSLAAPTNSDLPFREGWLRSREPEPVDWAAVLALVDRAIALDNYIYEWSEIQSHLLRGESLRNLGRESEALAEYAWVVEQRPDEYWATVGYGELAWQVEADLTKAVSLLEKAIELDAASKWAYLSLARIYDEAGQRDKAATIFEHVLTLDPNDWAANRWFAQHQ